LLSLHAVDEVGFFLSQLIAHFFLQAGTFVLTSLAACFSSLRFSLLVVINVNATFFLSDAIAIIFRLIRTFTL
jgi:hypothetical protein